VLRTFSLFTSLVSHQFPMVRRSFFLLLVIAFFPSLFSLFFFVDKNPRGKVSRKEIVFVAGSILALVVAIVVVAVVLVTRSPADAVDPTTTSGGGNKAADIGEPLFENSIQKFDYLMDAFDSNEAVAHYQDLFLPYALELRTVGPRKITDPIIMAVKWACFDTIKTRNDVKSELVPRFVLASLYYTSAGLRQHEEKGWNVEGAGWKELPENWFTKESVCSWGRVKCGQANTIEEIDMSDMNMTGILPESLAMLDDVVTLKVSSVSISRASSYLR